MKILYSFLLFWLVISCKSEEQKISNPFYSKKFKSDYTLLDSLKVSEIESLYCFIQTDFLGGGEKVYIAISRDVCTISKDKVIAEGNFISGFDNRNNNTIYLFGYEKPAIVDNLSRFNFEIRDLSDDNILETYRNRKFKRVNQSELCK